MSLKKTERLVAKGDYLGHGCHDSDLYETVVEHDGEEMSEESFNEKFEQCCACEEYFERGAGIEGVSNAPYCSTECMENHHDRRAGQDDRIYDRMKDAQIEASGPVAAELLSRPAPTKRSRH